MIRARDVFPALVFVVLMMTFFFYSYSRQLTDIERRATRCEQYCGREDSPLIESMEEVCRVR